MPKLLQTRLHAKASAVPTGTRRNWTLIIFRWTILGLMLACWGCAINDMVYYSEIIHHYGSLPECDFIKYEIVMLIASVVVFFVLLLGFCLVLHQNIKPLRSYLALLLACSWVELMLTLVLTQTYPLVHEIHMKWKKHESISQYETRFKCCGVMGPDDYLLIYGELPRSCFASENRTSHTLYLTGCLQQNAQRLQVVHVELATPICLFMLLACLVGFVSYLRGIKATKRNCQALCEARFFL